MKIDSYIIGLLFLSLGFLIIYMAYLLKKNDRNKEISATKKSFYIEVNGLGIVLITWGIFLLLKNV